MASTGGSESEIRETRFRWVALRWSAFSLLTYMLISYVLIPTLWRLAEVGSHPALGDVPKITRTSSHIPGDPINICLIGSEESVTQSLLAAGWFPADPLTLKSSLRIAGDSVLRRPYDDAPVSNLYVWGHKQDLAFEQPVGDDPRRRHHVRFWKSKLLDNQGLPLWVGAATYDEKVGFSHTTGQITHHIGPDVDAERDKILADLTSAARLKMVQWRVTFHSTLAGRNGGGDLWKTDGRLAIATLTSSH
ncbi:MAG: LssY C-terminal domain-containing protein [Planctomycetota bacterium]